MSHIRGKFIVFEGLDGCGKSTLMERLTERLNSVCRGRRVFATCEPSDNVPGLVCRGILKGVVLVRQETEALLFAADRYEHIQQEVLPLIQTGHHVLCDRFVLSNLAYQGEDRDMRGIINYNRAALELLTPDATVFIDVTPEECERRRTAARASAEKYENVVQAAGIRRRYLEAMELMGPQCGELLMVDGMGSFEQVFDSLWGELNRRVFTERDFG